MFSTLASGKTYFIAEIGSNFDGSLSRAKELIRLASQCGANAAKFQHYTANTLVSSQGFESLDNNSHQAKWKDSVFETYDKASLDVDWTEELYQCCKNHNLDFLTSPYSKDLLEKTIKYVPFVKIGSGDISDIDFLKYASSFGKPVALATGASSMTDVERAVEALDSCVPICLMQCNTNYESIDDHDQYQNISVLTTYKQKWPNLFLGLSCHMKTDLTVTTAVALGANVIEKHFTDDNTRIGPDHGFALSPDEFKNMVANVRVVERILGDGVKKIEPNELSSYPAQRRGIVAARDLKPGHILEKDDLIFLRPYTKTSFHPYESTKIIGHALTQQVKKFQPLSQSHLNSVLAS